MNRLVLAPAAAGKTAYALDLVRTAARNLQSSPRVVVPTRLQVHSWRRRLAMAGGAIGVRVLTFDQLYAECLQAAGRAYTELSNPVQYRLIRSVVDTLGLEHYEPLITRPGFIQVLQELIGELKAAQVAPALFSQAVKGMGSGSRLQELADIYAAYQARLQAGGWADRAGLGWLAIDALEGKSEAAACCWPLLVVDGFDNFTIVQMALLKALSGRVSEMVITLTGTAAGHPRPLVCRRFGQTQKKLEESLGVTVTHLREQRGPAAPELAHLEAFLFRGNAARLDSTGTVELVEAPDREAEVRAALRWLKARVIQDGMGLEDVALLMRKVEPYRAFIDQIAAEFGVPIRLLDGLPLRANPAVSALLDLLRLFLPRSTVDLGPSLPRRLVVEAWRSPYFDWSTLSRTEADKGSGISTGDADILDRVARWGRVMGGQRQWQNALDRLAALRDALSEEAGQDQEQGLPAGLPRGAAAQALSDKFNRFIHQVRPPEGMRTYREFVQWLEVLIGADPVLQPSPGPDPEDLRSLHVVAQARQGPSGTGERDVAALQGFKDVLRGLVWAEQALSETTTLPGGQPISFARFLDELTGAVDAATYQIPWHPQREEIVIADLVHARGVPFRAVAVLGLAEGEFPITIGEDPFLRDADRQHLREEFSLPLEPSTESAEVEFFYETVTRPWERLLLTRPRLADNGALWQASPFWEEVRRLVNVRPITLTSESIPPPEHAASWSELMACLAAHPNSVALHRLVETVQSDRYAAFQTAAHLFDVRGHGAASVFDGNLSGHAHEFERRFGPDHMWSASRLEAYRTCPFFFFVGHVLGLEPREDPAEGLDARQLGNLYHRILEQVYQSPEVDDPCDLDKVLVALPGVAGPILDAAPEEEGFRETAWWQQTRNEILENVRHSLVALAKVAGRYRPIQHEAAFGLRGQPPLVVEDGADRFALRGFIDRVDRTPGGRVRVIDYKTAGPWAYSKNSIAKGKKLQLPLYALAARDALGLGEPAAGFYWHVRQAVPSGFTLEGFDGGPGGAMDLAVEKAWEAVRSVREGHFVPQPADGNCPAYCPAASFCWQFQRGFGG